MKITSATAWILDERCAPAVRFMQDQPMVHAYDLAYAASFATRVAHRMDVTGLSPKQLAALDNIIAKRRWIEPPRWQAWAEAVKDYHGEDLYRITVCPGTGVGDQLSRCGGRARRHVRREITIGPLYECTRDVYDPRLDSTPSKKRRGKRIKYVTVCRRLVDEARSSNRQTPNTSLRKGEVTGASTKVLHS